MAEAATIPCAGCQRLKTQLEEQRAQLEQLQATVARLEEKLAAARKNSSTSSKPPSSDIVEPPPPPLPPGQDKRNIGGQPGHPKHERALFPDDQIDFFFAHPLHGCPCCGGLLGLNGISPGRPADRTRARDGDGRAAYLSRILVQPLRAILQGRLAETHRRWRSGRSTADYSDRLPRRLLPRFLLHHSQVPPRRGPGDHLARPVAKDHRQGQRGAERSLPGVARDAAWRVGAE